MKYKPFLLKDKKEKRFTLIHIDTMKVETSTPVYDSLNTITTTKNSPIKKIYLSKNKFVYD